MMLSKDSFYSDGYGAYVIGKMTDKTVLFTPVASETIGLSDISSAFLYNVDKRATRTPDNERKPIRFRLKNNFSTRGLAHFYENKNGVIKSMYEMDGDIFSIERNHG